MVHHLTIALVCLAALPLLAADSAPNWRTLVYKRAADLDIKAEVLDVAGADPKQVAESYAAAAEFLRKYLD